MAKTLSKESILMLNILYFDVLVAFVFPRTSFLEHLF
jgi:hypothetical protein